MIAHKYTCIILNDRLYSDHPFYEMVIPGRQAVSTSLSLLAHINRAATGTKF